MKKLILSFALLANSIVVKAQGPLLSAGTYYFDIKINWKMEERFGKDINHDGRIDIPNSLDYVQSKCDPKNSKLTFHTDFYADNSKVYQDVKGTILVSDDNVISVRDLEFKWKIVASGGNVVLNTDYISPVEFPRGQFHNVANQTICLEEGTYNTELGVRIKGTNIEASRSEKVIIEDLLIVSLGDSYASGEGNPEVTKTLTNERACGSWADDGTLEPWQRGCIENCGEGELNDSRCGEWSDIQTEARVYKSHRLAHRSILAATPQMALEIENSDPHTSVTFLFLAESGATIDKGLLGPFRETIGNQVEKMKGLVKNRRIDALYLSIGGNDVGFSKAVKALLIVPNSTIDDREEIYEELDKSLKTGNWRRWEDMEGFFFAIGGDFDQSKARGLNGLQDGYRKVMDSIEEMNIYSLNLVEYPYLGFETHSQFCNKILDGTPLPGAKIGRAELSHAYADVYAPLLVAMRDATTEYKWNYIGGIDWTFRGHGLCHNLPYAFEDYPGNRDNRSIQLENGNVRWGRRYKESKAIGSGEEGTLHPNEFGHQAIKNELLKQKRFPLPGLNYNCDSYYGNLKDARLNRAQYTLSQPEQGRIFLQSAVDYNTHKFALTKNESIQIKVPKDFFVNFYDSQGVPISSTLLSIARTFEQDKAIYTIHSNVSGEYYCTVAFMNDLPINLQLGLVESNPFFGANRKDYQLFKVKVPYEYEIEFNNNLDPDGTIDQPNDLGMGNTDGFGIETPEDHDFFKINIPEPGEYKVTINTKFNAPYSLAGINSNFEKVVTIRPDSYELSYSDAQEQPLEIPLVSVGGIRSGNSTSRPKIESGLVPLIKLYDKNKQLIQEIKGETIGFSGQGIYFIEVQSGEINFESIMERHSGFELVKVNSVRVASRKLNRLQEEIPELKPSTHAGTRNLRDLEILDVDVNNKQTTESLSKIRSLKDSNKLKSIGQYTIAIEKRLEVAGR